MWKDYGLRGSAFKGKTFANPSSAPLSLTNDDNQELECCHGLRRLSQGKRQNRSLMDKECVPCQGTNDTANPVENGNDYLWLKPRRKPKWNPREKNTTWVFASLTKEEKAGRNNAGVSHYASLSKEKKAERKEERQKRAEDKKNTTQTGMKI